MAFLPIFAFCFFLLHIKKSKEEKIFITEYKSVTNGYLFDFSVNQQDFASFTIPIDMNSHYTVLSNVTVDNPWNMVNESSTIMSDKGTVVQVKEMIKQISFAPDNVMNFSFYLLDDNTYIRLFPRALAVPFIPDNERFSFVHQLKRENLIDQLSFGFEPIKSNSKGIFFFGGIPSLSLEKQKDVIKCIVNDSYKQWGCNFDAVYISQGNKVLNYSSNTYYAFFQSAAYYIDVPIKFVDFLIDTVFMPFISKEECAIKRNQQVFQYTGFLQCECKVIYNLPEINFVFGNKAIQIKLANLFEIYEGSILDIEFCELLLRPNYNDNAWVFGTKFFENFLINFDYKNKDVSLYYEYEFEHNLLENLSNISNQYNIIKKILFIVIFSSLGNILYLLLIKKMMK